MKDILTSGGQERSIETMSEPELRQEVIDSVNYTIGKLPIGPPVDGSAVMGYRRRDLGLYDLVCSRVRYTKVYDPETEQQSGVQIELFFLSQAQYYPVQRRLLEEKLQSIENRTEEEKLRLQQLIEGTRLLGDQVAKDGLAPAENRYYYIPFDPNQKVIVSTESFISRAHRANPERAEGFFLKEDVESAKTHQEEEIDRSTGLPRKKGASLQDLRDAANIIRHSKFLVSMAVDAGREDWGEPGFTE